MYAKNTFPCIKLGILNSPWEFHTVYDKAFYEPLNMQFNFHIVIVMQISPFRIATVQVSKVIDKSRGEVYLLEQDTIENVS